MEWITESHTYLDWVGGSDTSILHVLGPPGAGSTVLAIKILNLLRTMNHTTKNATIISFCFKADDVRCRSLRMLFLALSHQLLSSQPVLFRRRSALCMALMDQGCYNERNLWVLLKSLLASHVCGPVFCILHAVHNCESPLESLLQELIPLGSLERESPSLKILLTSSESYELDLPVEHYRSISLADEVGMESAVKEAVRARMTSLAQKKPVWQGDEETAIEKLCETGITYLEAMQKMDELEDASTRSTKVAIARKLEDIPSSLDDIYERVLTRIRSVEDGWVESALTWLVCAARPLRISEMAVAVALKDLDSKLDVAHRGHAAKAFKLLPKIIPWDIWGDLSRVVGPLVKIVDDEIHPIHQSLRQFLSRKYASSHQAIHRRILTKCLDYLEMASQGCPYLKGQVDVDDSTWTSMSSEMEYAFLSYAALYWPKHYERAKLESTDVDQIFEFLEKNVQTWSRVYRYLDAKSSTPRFPLLDTPLKVACKFGISALVDKALQSTGIEDDCQEALDLAAQNGHLGVVEKLIAKDVQPSKSTLELAADGGFTDILDHILQADPAIINEIDVSGCTPLMRAAQRGHGDAVLLLLHKGANVNARTANKSTALHAAARLGLCDIVRILVDAGADLVIVDDSGYDALRIAAAGGFDDIVKLLIECRIDVKGSTVEGETALHLAALYGHHRVISLLISEAGAVVNSVNKKGLTPLHLASREGYLDVVQLLLEAEAYPSAQPTKDDKDGQDELQRPVSLIPGILTPLQLAALGGYADVVREFLSSKPDLPVSDRQTAANVAAAAGHLVVMEELMNSLSIEWEGGTTLHQAAKCGLTNVVTELLKYQQFRKTINATNETKWTPLHKAANSGYIEVVRILISHGAEIDRKNDDGDTPIHLACRKGHLSVVQELLTSEKQTSDEDRQRALHLAIWHGHVDAVKVLLQFEETGPDESDSTDDGDAAIPKSLLEINYKDDYEYDPNKDEKDSDNETSSACMVRLLCQAGAHVNATNSSKQTPLCLAAQRGDILAATVLLEHGAYVDAADANGATPLYNASYYGYEKVVRLLLAWDADLNAQTTDYKGWTALHAAMDHAGITKMLLDAGADPNFKDADGSISLTFAASNDYTEVVSVLLEHHVDVNSANSAKSTPLHHAARYNSLESIKLLVKAGARCDAKDSDGNTPLHTAIVKEYTAVVEYLLDHVTDMEIQSDVYGTPLTAATVAGNVTIAQLLILRGAKVNTLGGPYESALESAAWQGEPEMIQLLLKHGADVNARGGKFGSPLQAGIEDRNANTVRILLNAGANVGVEVDRYNTTIQMAAALDAADIVELLLEYGAYVNVTGGMFGTPLNAAVESGSMALVERLLGHQADPNIRVDNLTALHTAVRRGLPEIFELLVTKGADIKVKDDNGRSMMSYAVVWESKSIIKYLLSKPEIDIDDKDSAARTPLLAAVRQGSGFMEIVEALLARGVDVNARDSEAKTPLIVAATLGNVETVKLLLDYKADPTITDGCRRGPLYWACRSGKSMEIFDSIEVALRGRSELNAHCEMAICAAVASNQSEILAKLLAMKGVYPNKPDRDGWTPLYTARRYGFEEIEQLLMDANTAQPKLSLEHPSGWHCTDKSPALLVSPDAQEVFVGSRWQSCAVSIVLLDRFFSVSFFFLHHLQSS
jgi:ankyrin repeat protein